MTRSLNQWQPDIDGGGGYARVCGEKPAGAEERVLVYLENQLVVLGGAKGVTLWMWSG